MASVQGWRSRRSGAACVPAVLRRLAAGADSRVLAPAALARLAASHDRDVQAAALGDARCPTAALENINGEVSGSVHLSVATLGHCPPHLLERLSWCGFKSVRSVVGSHPGCPLHVLTEFVEDGISEERAGWQRTRRARSICSNVSPGTTMNGYWIRWHRISHARLICWP